MHAPHKFNKEHSGRSWYMYAAVSDFHNPAGATGYATYYKEFNGSVWSHASAFVSITEVSKTPLFHDLVTDSDNKDMFITDPGYAPPYNNRVCTLNSYVIMHVYMFYLMSDLESSRYYKRHKSEFES